MRRAVAEPYAIALQRYLQQQPGVLRVEIAGSFRRGLETVGDLDFVMASNRPLDLRAALERYDEAAVVHDSGPTRATMALKSGLQVDVRLVHAGSFGSALHYFTGSKAHNLHLRRLAQERGLKLNEYGLHRGAVRIAGDSEEAVFAALGLQPIPPELREDRGEIEAARAGRLPRLAELGDLRGDLHVHTRASDGTASLEQMATAAHAARLRYIAITDHVTRLGAVRSLDAGALARQIDAIDRLNDGSRRVGTLKGAEVDILENGALAMPDELLRRLDLVVIAVHSRFELARRKQTERLLRALDQRCASVLAHPSARLIGERAPLDVDWDLVLERAAARPLYLEINAQPTRLDCDGRLAREAAARGVLLAISSDAHRVDDFALLRHGVLQARRGWLEPRQIINCRPPGELRKLLARTLASLPLGEHDEAARAPWHGRHGAVPSRSSGYCTLISMGFGFLTSSFGTWTASTPSLLSARMCSPSASAGSSKLRRKLP